MKRTGLIPPDAAGLLGVGETITYATHRGLTSTGSLAREFRRSDISAVAPINGLPPTTATYQRLLAGNFAEWRLAVDGLVARPEEFTLDELKRSRVPGSDQDVVIRRFVGGAGGAPAPETGIVPFW